MRDHKKAKNLFVGLISHTFKKLKLGNYKIFYNYQGLKNIEREGFLSIYF